MNFFSVILFAGLGLFISWLGIPFIIRKAHAAGPRELERKFHHTHKNSVSRLGGVALAVAFAVAATAVFYFFPSAEKFRVRCAISISALAMFGLGFFDDLKPLGARRKLLGQILISVGAYYLGVEISTFKNPLTRVAYDLGVFSLPVTVFWLVAFTNLINLIDGVDGLAGGIALMLMLLLLYVGFSSGMPFSTLSAAAMCGALLGFLYYNFPPAKIFLGDGGAYFLGFLIACLAITNSHKGTVAAAMIAPVFALALPIIDVSLAVLRRGLRGLPIFRPDRKHIHHRLMESGNSRQRTVLLLYGFSLVFLAVAFGIFVLQHNWMPIVLGGIFLVILSFTRSFRFYFDWLSIGKIMGNSLETRKEIQYVLQWARLLEMEAERCQSIASLWTDFKVMARKLNFARVELHLEGAIYTYSASAPGASNKPDFYVRHELPGAHRMALEFWKRSEGCEEKNFLLLSELLAEAWTKATTRWQELSARPLYLEKEPERSVSTLPEEYLAPSNLASNP